MECAEGVSRANQPFDGSSSYSYAPAILAAAPVAVRSRWCGVDSVASLHPSDDPECSRHLVLLLLLLIIIIIIMFHESKSNCRWFRRVIARILWVLCSPWIDWSKPLLLLLLLLLLVSRKKAAGTDAPPAAIIEG